MSDIVFNNPWMRLVKEGDKKFIISDDKRFLVKIITHDLNIANVNCDDDNAVIATDSDGRHYVAAVKAS